MSWKQGSQLSGCYKTIAIGIGEREVVVNCFVERSAPWRTVLRSLYHERVVREGKADSCGDLSMEGCNAVTFGRKLSYRAFRFLAKDNPLKIYWKRHAAA